MHLEKKYDTPAVKILYTCRKKYYTPAEIILHTRRKNQLTQTV